VRDEGGGGGESWMARSVWEVEGDVYRGGVRGGLEEKEGVRGKAGG